MPAPFVHTAPSFWQLPVSALFRELAAGPGGLSCGEGAHRLKTCELTIALNRVDDDYLSHPRHWDRGFLRNFMLVIGPVSSILE